MHIWKVSIAIALLMLGSICELKAKELKVAAGLTRAPYLMSKSQKGIEVDIVRATLKKAGYASTFSYMPYRLGFSKYNKGSFDAVITATDALPLNSAFLSTPYMSYQNIVVTLTKNQFNINDVADLKGKRIVAFPQAKKYLGKAFNDLASNSKKYKEFTNHSKQILMLLTQRTDAIVLDEKIFHYFYNQLQSTNMSNNLDFKLSFHRIFKPFPVSVAFSNQEIRDNFNEAFSSLENNGKIDAIVQQYVQLQK